MFLDSLDQLMSDFAPTTGSTNYSKYIDRLAKMEDGAGDPIYIYGLVTTTATSGGSNTTQFKIIGNATDPTFASGNVTLLDSGAIAVATLVAGYQFLRAVIPRQPTGSLEQTGSFLRYITAVAVIATADLTAGKFSIWATPAPLQDNLSYPRGYSV